MDKLVTVVYRVVIIGLLSLMFVPLGCTDDSTEDQCIREANKIRKEINSISDQLRLGTINPDVAIIRIRQYEDKLYDLMEKCN